MSRSGMSAGSSGGGRSPLALLEIEDLVLLDRGGVAPEDRVRDQRTAQLVSDGAPALRAVAGEGAADDRRIAPVEVVDAAAESRGAVPGEDAADHHGAREDVRDAIVSGIPMRRMGAPEEIASAVAFLAAEANGYVTGANIPVNGGLFMH